MDAIEKNKQRLDRLNLEHAEKLERNEQAKIAREEKQREAEQNKNRPKYWKIIEETKDKPLTYKQLCQQQGVKIPHKRFL